MWNHKNRNFGLDVLRAAAILLVLISHCTFLYPKFNPQLTDGIRLLGATGVDLFFVLLKSKKANSNQVSEQNSKRNAFLSNLFFEIPKPPPDL